MSNNDQILEMFFDKDFIPQAYVDILLSNANSQDTTQVQAVLSSLLYRLDFYTKNLTNELKTSIENLEKLSDIIPGTWSSSNHQTKNDGIDIGAIGASKLEYYLDTLGSAVRALETDMSKIDNQLQELESKYQGSDGVVEQLEKLVTIKDRLNRVVQCFEELKTILNISVRSTDSNQQSTLLNDGNVTISDFKLSLKTLEETIDESLKFSSRTEKRNERNRELLKKIDHFIELKPIFKGLDKFYPVYSEFAEGIKKKSEVYLSTKDMEDQF